MHHKIKASLNTKFLLSIGIIITLILAPAFYWLSKEQESHILTQVGKQAHILFQQLVLERKWIAKHGGVYVEKRPGIKSSPYLKNPDIKTGKMALTKRNPAFVNREMAEYAAQEGLYWRHITSLKLMNPKNAPDPLEKQALMQFETGEIKELKFITTKAPRTQRI